MKKIIEGSRAIAETVSAIGPAVVAAYPITPQTHIVEELAKIKAAGQGNFEYLRSESEFAAASIVAGASAAGVRTYTATSSQGLLLMAEVLFNIAGMRLPVVLTCANRAVSAPINIWNDQQDIMTIRDSGWLIWFGENNQEVCDLHLLAYKVAEKIQLPVSVNLDGFILTHTVEPVIIETPAKISRFLPAYRPADYLDINRPLSFGALVGPADYFEMREALHYDLIKSKEVISQEIRNFKKHFGRSLDVVQYYGPKDAETVLVAMGSVVGTIKDTIDELNKKSRKIAVLKIVSFRPFPDLEVARALTRAKRIAVIDKSISLGTEGVLATELRRVLDGDKKIVSLVLGLGGRDITSKMIMKAVVLAGKKQRQAVFIGQ